MSESKVMVFAAVFAAAALSAFGAGVSGDDAKGAVAGWVSLREALGDEIDAEPESVATYQGRDGVGEFHVVSLKGGGYVITSGDTEITPILGYSKTGTFDADENSPMWALLTVDVAARAAALGGSPSSATAQADSSGRRLSASGGSSSSSTAQDKGSPASEWERLMAAGKSGGKRLQARLTSPPADLRVASFVQSKWSQRTATSGNGYSHNYYNNYTPNKYPCGCVATAQAQAMRYFEYPKTSVAAKTFTCKVSGVETNLTMQGGTYDWAHMPYVPRDVTYDWNNVIGIAKLTSDAGISVCMNYSSSGSGASGLSVGDSLVSTFGYSNAIADYEGGGIKGDTFKKNVIPSLDAKLPVLLGIHGYATGSSTSDSGHAILADGYGYYNEELYLHLNLGWGGSDDSWYTPATINTSGYVYTNILCTVFNIFTNATQYSVIASGRVLDQDGEAISSATVTAKYNNTTYATATSDERGVYALILPPTSSTRTYTVNATHLEYTSIGARSVRASRTRGDDPVKEGNNYTGSYYPRASNSNSYDNDITMEARDLPQLPTPESPTATEFETSANVTLTCATNGATIYYTLDGSTPTASSTLYTGPIVLTKTTTVKARAFKSGYARSDVFTRTFVSAAAIDEYYFRHDFSGGTQVFTAGEGTGLTRDQVSSADSSNAKAVAGPDGPGTAFHPGNAWGQFERPAVLHGAWSAAMSLCMDATENGVLVSFGRLNTTDQKEVALLSSSTKSNLYFKVMTTDSNKTKSVENTFTVVTTNDLTEGFHTIVVAYTPASEVLNGVGSFDIYCDGALSGSFSTTTTKRLGADVGGMQYCMLMSGGSDLAALGAVSSQTNDEVAFYDFRFYDRAFTASEAAKYATAYPGTAPEPEPGPEPEPTPSLTSAYAQSGSENFLLHLDAVENAGVGLHLASPATWADLTGNHAVTNKNSATFSNDAFVANASSYFLGCSDAVKTALTGNSAALTLELVISHPSSQNQYENWVYHGNSGSRNLIVDMRSNNSKNPIVQGVQYRATGWNGNATVTKGTKTAWNKRTYIAVVCNGNTATTYCDGKVQLHSITGSATPSANLMSIGASTSGSNPLTSKSEICAVRMTSRILSEDERMRNFFVDSQRFGLEGAPDGYRLTNGVVQVRLTEGVEGFEFSTNGTMWAEGEVWSDINQPVTLSARLAERPSMAVAFSDLPVGATVSGGSAAFTPTKPCTVTVSAVQWTNNDGTGSLDSTANWTGGGIPQSGDFIVSISGDTTITVTNAYNLGVMTVKGTGRVTFTGDGSIGAATLEVGSGLTVDAGGVLSAAGFTGAGNVVLRPVAGSLAISSASTLTGDLTVKTDTITAFNVTAATSVRKFYVDAATNAVVTLTVGSGGSFKATSEAIVQHGVLKQGSATALGTTPKITVQDGGTFDINGKTIRQETPIYIAGAGAGDWPWALATSSAMASGNYLYDLYLNANATIGKGQFKLGRSNQNSFIYLNGHTLTAKSWLTLRCINTMAGTIDLQNGATINAYNNLNRQTAYRGTTLIVHEGYTISNKTDREVDISYLRMYGGTIGYDSAARDFGVWNELHGYGTVKRLVIGSGAKYYPDGAHYLEVPEKLSGTMIIDLGDIDLSTAKGRIPLFKVGTAEILPAAEALQFVGGIPRGWHLESSKEGYGYDLVYSTFNIIIR